MASYLRNSFASVFKGRKLMRERPKTEKGGGRPSRRALAERGTVNRETEGSKAEAGFVGWYGSAVQRLMRRDERQEGKRGVSKRAM